MTQLHGSSRRFTEVDMDKVVSGICFVFSVSPNKVIQCFLSNNILSEALNCVMMPLRRDSSKNTLRASQNQSS